MEQPGNRRAIGQIVVDLYRFAGLGHMHRDRTLIQVAAGIWVNVQLLVHALGQHDGGRSVGHELTDASQFYPPRPSTSSAG